MNVLDILIIIVVVVFCIRGFLKGFVHELFTLGILVLGLAGGLLFFRPLGAALQTTLRNQDLSLILAFFIIFIAVALFLVIVRNALIGLVDRANLADIDYLLGILVGLLEGLLVCGVLLLFLERHPVLGIERIIASSLLYPHIKDVCVLLARALPEAVRAPVSRVLGL
ncbi:MAG: CvpA family protein [Spirochaetota bacterium]